ncbi:hypothetical protein H2248_007019 [Termitomyces sp. 'cryptogamus']|nr:hypothetical protein H2248_007019 [Termitomyces sp. 'cryptogamus']
MYSDIVTIEFQTCILNCTTISSAVSTRFLELHLAFAHDTELVFINYMESSICVSMKLSVCSMYIIATELRRAYHHMKHLNDNYNLRSCL